MWSVTAVNPAGISVPANYTTAVLFKQGTYMLVFACKVLVNHVYYNTYIMCVVIIYCTHVLHG